MRGTTFEDRRFENRVEYSRRSDNLASFESDICLCTSHAAQAKRDTRHGKNAINIDAYIQQKSRNRDRASRDKIRLCHSPLSPFEQVERHMENSTTSFPTHHFSSNSSFIPNIHSFYNHVKTCQHCSSRCVPCPGRFCQASSSRHTRRRLRSEELPRKR